MSGRKKTSSFQVADGIHKDGLHYLEDGALTTIRQADITEADRCVAFQCLGSPSGTQYMGAITGRALRKDVMEVLRMATSSLRASSTIYDDSQYVFLGDFLAEQDQGENDKRSLALLRRAAELPVTTPFARNLLLPNRPLLSEHGVPALKAFFEDVLYPQLNPETVGKWLWGDVAMVVIVVTTSALWERRLARIFDEGFLPKRAVAAIAKYVLATATQLSPDELQAALRPVHKGHKHVKQRRDYLGSPESRKKPTCDTDPLLTLTALTMLHSEGRIVDVPG